MMQYAFFFILPTMMPLLVCEQKYPPSATTLHFEFYAEPGPEVKVERKVKTREINLCSTVWNVVWLIIFPFVPPQQTSSNTLHYIHIEQLDKV